MGRPVAPPAMHRAAVEAPRHLPPGFRFHPTDEELVVQYLLRKVLSRPLPAAVIPVVHDVAKLDPWDLPGLSEGGEAYFFSLRQAPARGRKGGSGRWWRAGSGYWKATGKDKLVFLQGSGCGGGRKLQLVGVKTALAFHRGKPSSSRTDWIMHEYRLAAMPSGVTEQKRHASNNCMAQLGEWAVCRVSLKNGARRTTGEDQTPASNRAAVVHSAAQHREDADIDIHQPVLSWSSCVTDVSDEEVSSSIREAPDASRRGA